MGRAPGTSPHEWLIFDKTRLLQVQCRQLFTWHKSCCHEIILSWLYHTQKTGFGRKSSSPLVFIFFCSLFLNVPWFFKSLLLYLKFSGSEFSTAWLYFSLLALYLSWLIYFCLYVTYLGHTLERQNPIVGTWWRDFCEWHKSICEHPSQWLNLNFSINKKHQRFAFKKCSILLIFG